MNEIIVRPLKDIGVVNRFKDYVLIHLSGLIGDTIHASTRFNEILEKYPHLPWIVIHSYPVPNRCEDRVKQIASELLSHFFQNGRIAYYFYSSDGVGGSPLIKIRSVVDAIRFCRIPPERIFECLFSQPKTPRMTKPYLNISIDKPKDLRKAVIFRYSSWHNHFLERNRPFFEWNQIEQKLLDTGYQVTLLGLEDPMPITSGVTDFRRKLNLHEILEYTSDAGLCITVATFLYVWTQFICRTLVLSDRRDCSNLNTKWKLNENLRVIDVNSPNYLQSVLTYIEKNRG